MTDMQIATKSNLMECQCSTNQSRVSDPRSNGWFRSAAEALTKHWPEYLMEAAGLGLFMISACTVAVILDHPASLVRSAIPNSFVRRILGGVAMGLTAMGLIYSPWGKRSGAHLNPSTTLIFFRLGKIEPADAFFYTFSQFAGGVAGGLFSASFLGGAGFGPAHRLARHPSGSRPGG